MQAIDPKKRSDRLTPEARSWNMSRIKGKDTKPEMAVRRLVHAMGFRFRLHRKNLPGRPDLAFRAKQKAIFVHGCFWHRHQGCKNCTTPGTRREFWQAKFDENTARDIRNQKDLEALGWQTLVVWECEVDDIETLAEKIRSFLDS